MTAKRFWKYIPDSCNPYGVVIRIVDNETGKQHGTIDDYVDLLNELHEENNELRLQLNLCSDQRNEFHRGARENANRVGKLKKENEELKSKVKRYMEIELLKAEDFANCHNCRNDRSVHDGVALDGMCAIKGLMNLGGYFDTEYHKLPKRTICPCWELEV